MKPETYDHAAAREWRDEIENLLDQSNLSLFLEAIEIICNEKAGHVIENWGDDRLAKDWELAAKVVGRAALNKYVVRPS